MNAFFRYSIFEHCKLNHFTTTVHGGVSSGNYATFNLCSYSGDSVTSVSENRALLANTLGISKNLLFIPRQTHGDQLRIIDGDFLDLSEEDQQKELYGVDALITQEKNVGIGVITADCVPISIYDTKNAILGIVHAGWKGTAARIGSKTVVEMMSRFSSKAVNLKVSIGPSISKENFEVGDEVGQAFIDAGFDLETIAYRKGSTEKLHIDLWRANIESLMALGILENNIEVSGICTFESTDFFSARRQTFYTGRMFTGGIIRE